jgi:two-component system, cell cycle sensor histidine kinase and response regulator CckA
LNLDEKQRSVEKAVKNAETFIFQYLNAYLTIRDFDSVASMLHPKINGVGTGADEIAVDLLEALSLYERDLQNIPEPIEFFVCQKSFNPVSEDVVVAFLVLDWHFKTGLHQVSMRGMRLSFVLTGCNSIPSIFHMHVSTASEMHDEGESYPMKEIGLLTDRLHQEIAEKTKALEKFRHLFEGAENGILVTRGDTIEFANPAIERILGHHAAKITSEPFITFIHPDDRETVLDRHIRRMQGEDLEKSYDFRVVSSDGTVRWLNLSTQLISWDGDLANLSFVNDITKSKRAEEALRESEEKHRLLFETMAQGVIYQAADGAIISVNPAAERILGLSVDQMQGKTYSDQCWSMIKEDGTKVLGRDHPCMVALRTGETVGPVVRGVRHTVKNTYIWLSITAIPLFQPGDTKPFQTYATFEDITERKLAREALRESEERFQKMLSLVPDMISIHDTDMNIIYSNWNGFGAVSEEKQVLNTKCYWTYRGYDDICPDCRAKAVFETGKPFQEEVKLSGGRWIDLRVFPMLDENGTAELFVEWVRDITENKLAEDALIQNKKLLEGIINGIPDILAIQNPDLTIELYNQAGYDAIGLPPEAIKNRKCYQLIGRVSECDRCTSRAALRTKMLAEEERYVPELGRHYNCRSNPILDKDGNVVHIIEQLRDITEQKQAEKEREKLHAQLIQAQKMETIGQLAGGVAHDFNNMLGVILGYAEMALAQMSADQPMYKTMHKIQQAAQRSADLTRHLLAFARKQTIAPKVIDLNQTVEGVLSMLRRLIGEDIGLIWQPGRNLHPVKMDPTQIDQILANLCVNARDAIEGVGKVIIETGVASVDEVWCTAHVEAVPGEYVLLAVSDNGCGMDQKTISHLFEPFFTTKEQGKGTGLGLPSVYGAVKQNNGFITVDSEPGQGSTFKIYLPQHVIRTEPLPVQDPAGPAARGHETILLVEDELTILEMTTIILERLGYNVLAASSPEEAIRLAGEYSGRIDLLMTDVVMPGMNGRKLAGNLLAHYPGIKLLFMSGYTDNVIAHHGVLDEGVHFIQKPFSMKDLGTKLREALEG